MTSRGYGARLGACKGRPAHRVTRAHVRRAGGVRPPGSAMTGGAMTGGLGHPAWRIAQAARDLARHPR